MGAFSFSVNSATNWLMIVLSLVGFGIQGLTEEVICRGYIQTGVIAHKGMVWGVLVNSIIFVLLHAMNPGMTFLPILNLFIFAVVFSLLYLLTDNIWIVGAAHTAWNFLLAPGLGIKVSGNRFVTSILEGTSIVGKELLNGAAFGAEGSILTTIFGILACIYMVQMTRKKNLY